MGSSTLSNRANRRLSAQRHRTEETPLITAFPGRLPAESTGLTESATPDHGRQGPNHGYCSFLHCGNALRLRPGPKTCNYGQPKIEDACVSYQVVADLLATRFLGNKVA